MSDRRRHKRRGDTAARQERVRQVADVLREFPRDGSAFRYEAACTHGIRRQLCLNGWYWADAQHEARQLVQGALDIMGARRPPAYMTQPEYALREHQLVERTRCRRCGNPLPDDGQRQRKFCSDLCKDGAARDRQEADERDRQLAEKRARAAAWRAEKRKAA